MKKTCKKCKQEKNIQDFSKKGVLNNRQNYRAECIPCYKKLEKKYGGERFKNYRERYPKRNKARDTLRSHVALGKIIKPSICSGCFKTLEKPKIHGHHNDYDKPLEVIWVCSRCHIELHQKLRLTSHSRN